MESIKNQKPIVFIDIFVLYTIDEKYSGSKDFLIHENSGGFKTYIRDAYTMCKYLQENFTVGLYSTNLSQAKFRQTYNKFISLLKPQYVYAGRTTLESEDSIETSIKSEDIIYAIITNHPTTIGIYGSRDLTQMELLGFTKYERVLNWMDIHKYLESYCRVESFSKSAIIEWIDESNINKISTFKIDLRIKTNYYFQDIILSSLGDNIDNNNNIKQYIFNLEGKMIDVTIQEPLIDYFKKLDINLRSTPLRGKISRVREELNTEPVWFVNCWGKPQDCSICQGTDTVDTRMIRVSCAHIYHEACITPWLSKNKTCPECRSQLVFYPRSVFKLIGMQQGQLFKMNVLTKGPNFGARSMKVGTDSIVKMTTNPHASFRQEWISNELSETELSNWISFLKYLSNDKMREIICNCAIDVMIDLTKADF